MLQMFQTINAINCFFMMTIRQKLLQTFYPALMKLSGFAQKKDTASHAVTPIVSIYDLEVIAINGEPFDLHQVVGKKLMIVNTASDCGYTKQLGALESLWQKHSKQLLILGFPSNDFREQETGSDQEIAAFCQKNYGVSFPMMKKAGVVINPNQQPVYHWLTDPAQNGWNKTPPTWNFNKFIVDEKGWLTHVFGASADPLGKEIAKALQLPL